MDRSRILDVRSVTNFGRRGWFAGVYWAVEVASVVVAALLLPCPAESVGTIEGAGVSMSMFGVSLGWDDI
jgi:hypothetical protein